MYSYLHVKLEFPLIHNKLSALNFYNNKSIVRTVCVVYDGNFTEAQRDRVI